MTLAEPAAMAHGPRDWRPPPPVVQPAVSVSLESARGHALTTVRHHGKTFVAGEHGDRYEIRITNNTSSRVEVVVSVDGRDAVSGKLGNFATQRGYVLEPFGTAVIDGFRTSLQQVAAFRFSSVEDSFTGRLGTPQHAGVIGVAVFKEQPRRMARPHAVAPAPKSASKSKKPGRAAPSGGSQAPSTSSRSGWSPPRDEAANELGTEFGEQRRSAVREVSFTRANARRPDFTTQLFYDSARGLAARGVPIEVEPVIVHRPAPGPDAWPGAASNERFAQPPPGWRRR